LEADPQRRGDFSSFFPKNKAFSSIFWSEFLLKRAFFEIKNNKLDQLQGMSAKMAANGTEKFLLTYPEADLTYYF